MNELDLFIAALDKEDPAERAAYLAEACGDDTNLRGRLDRLLRLHSAAGQFLEKPAIALGETVDSQPGESPDEPEQVRAEGLSGASPTPLAEAVGTRLGPYKLLQKLGEGGMGVVWVAEQTEPVRRRVALKVIKPGMDSARVLHRFEAERQALALMDHSHIAKVLDAGTTPEGRPYFVMELVKGVPITRYCDELHLTLRERLELFVPVCQAIQHAHQKGIIHRDCLAVREKKDPDAWTTFHTKSLLGGALLGQKKYAEAEPLLLAGYEGLKQREAKMPAEGKLRLTQALERLVQLYDAWGQKDKADAWRTKLEETKTAAKSPANP